MGVQPIHHPRAGPDDVRELGLDEHADVRRVNVAIHFVESVTNCCARRDHVCDRDPASRATYPTHLGGCSLGFGKVVERGSTHLAGITAREVCRAVGLSEWTMRRRFSTATGMSWRRYLLEARLLRSMALLVEPGSTVLNVSMTVGFDSVSAFSRAFGTYTRETPSSYRRRVTADSTTGGSTS